VKPLTLGRLNDVWQKVLRDPDGHKALRRLERGGFGIAHLRPRDPTFKHPNWSDYIAAIPFLPNRSSRRQIHRRSVLRKHLSLVRALRDFAGKVNDPFCQVSIQSTRDLAIEEIRDLGKHLTETAEFLEKFLSWDWYTRETNARNCCIAELRWTIRERTGVPHDRDLSILIDAAYRAAGNNEGFYLDATTLERIEKREKEGRVKATCRLRGLTVPSSIAKAGGLSRSTRFHRNRGKRV
jgi:hypothetical protein